MTDSATLRASLVEKVARKISDEIWGKETWDHSSEEHRASCYEAAFSAIDIAHSSWANEKAELERQLSEADAAYASTVGMLGIRAGDIDFEWLARICRESLERHASRPVTEKD